MILKSTVLFLVIVAVKSAVLQGRNIPVEVRYERLGHKITNLEEKIQLSQDEIRENNLRLQNLSAEDEEIDPTSGHHKFTKNFDEKVQLSSEELLQSAKHLPIQHEIQGIKETDDHQSPESLRGNLLSENESNKETKISFIQQAQDIVENSLKNLKNNFKPQGDQKSPSKDLWEKLEGDVKNYFKEAKNKFSLRQDQGSTTPSSPTIQQQNFVQNIMQGLQQMTGSFVQQFQSQSPPSGTSGDEGQQQQPQGPFAGFMDYFTGGVQTMFNNIQNIGQGGQQSSSSNSTVLGDTGTDNQSSQVPGNFFGNMISNVQQFFAGQNQGAAGSQDGTPVNNGGVQQGIFTGPFQFLNPGSATQPPAAQSDEGSNTPAPSGPLAPLQQAAQNIGSAFNQFFQGGQQSNKPQGSEDEGSTKPPTNFFQNIGQNIGTAIQNIQNQIRPQGSGDSTTKPSVEDSNGSSNPVGQAANAIGSQIVGAFGNNSLQNIIPGGSIQSPSEGASSDNPNPIEQTANLIGNQIQNQVAGFTGGNPIQNLIPGSSNPVTETSKNKPVTETKPPGKPSPAAEVSEDIGKKSEQMEKQAEVMTADE